jgi:DNA polymerase iota
VFLDVTDIVDYNVDLLNRNDVKNSFFCLSQSDPTIGFPFDATTVQGHTFPEELDHHVHIGDDEDDSLRLRLHVGSHLAHHLRKQLEERKGFTSTVGISTSKLLSKLAGNVHKPRAQTTLMPPYISSADGPDNVTEFLDKHEIGKIPGIGFKLSQKIRDYILQKTPHSAAASVSRSEGGIVTVKDVRTHPSMSPELLDRILGGPGSPREIGFKVWSLIHGVDDSVVAQASEVPKQISIEDSYTRLDSFDDAVAELKTLSRSLIDRMRVDLVEIVESEGQDAGSTAKRRWLAVPKTLRLSTRPRSSQNQEGLRVRSSSRISRSSVLPNFVFDLSESPEALAERLVVEAILPLFRRLHSEKNGWDLSLINIAVVNMIDTASDSKGATGRDISKMFQQPAKMTPWKFDQDMKQLGGAVPSKLLYDDAEETHPSELGQLHSLESLEKAAHVQTQHDSGEEDGWDSEDTDGGGKDWLGFIDCKICGAHVPAFANAAHQRFHLVEGG